MNKTSGQPTANIDCLYSAAQIQQRVHELAAQIDTDCQQHADGLIDDSISGKHVLIVEDIIDTGHTLQQILRRLAERQPASLRVCTLLDKPSRRRVAVSVDYVGFQIDDVFVIGYGMDDAQQYRHLPYIGVKR